jgi:hypothetical protein
VKQIPTEDVSWYESHWDYPWHDWLNGLTWLLVPGEDFTEPLASFRARLYRGAAGFGYRIRTRMTAAGLAIQALGSDGEELEQLPE